MRGRLHNGHVLGVAAMLTPLLGLYAPHSLAPLVVLVAVVATAVHRRRTGSWPVPGYAAAAVLAGLVAWAALSLTWTIQPLAGAANALARLAGSLTCGVVVLQIAARLDEAERALFRALLVTGFGLALVLVAMERVTEFPLYRYLPSADWPAQSFQSFNRGLTVLGLVVFPVALAVWRRSSMLSVGAWGVTLAVVLAFSSGSALAAVALGGGVAVAAYAAPRVTAVALGAMLVCGVLLAPVAWRVIPAPEALPQISAAMPGSTVHRWLIWRFTAARVAERPLLGWGFDSSRSIPGSHEMLGMQGQSLPLHPHNAPLQWWLELGLPGALLGAALHLAALRAITAGSLTRPAIAAAQGLLISAAVVANLSYGTWQNWWLAALALSAAFLTAAAPHRDAPA
jgi:exopolysaccharide production protein ExoQ